MDITYTPFHAAHLETLTPHESQVVEYGRLRGPMGLALASRSVALTAWAGVRCIGAGGVFLAWEGRAEAWGLFSKDAGRFIVPVARKIRTILDAYPVRRLEMTVKEDNVCGQRLARILGFGKPEAYLHAYHPDGSDMYMYAKVR